MRYKLFSETKFQEEYGWYRTYGIIAVRRGQTASVIGDISLDKAKLLPFVKKLNKEKLELCHLKQVVEEFLYNFEV